MLGYKDSFPISGAVNLKISNEYPTIQIYSISVRPCGTFGKRNKKRLAGMRPDLIAKSDSGHCFGEEPEGE